jgi:hypothetical protein
MLGPWERLTGTTVTVTVAVSAPLQVESVALDEEISGPPVAVDKTEVEDEKPDTPSAVDWANAEDIELEALLAELIVVSVRRVLMVTEEVETLAVTNSVEVWLAVK